MMVPEELWRLSPGTRFLQRAHVLYSTWEMSSHKTGNILLANSPCLVRKYLPGACMNQPEWCPLWIAFLLR